MRSADPLSTSRARRLRRDATDVERKLWRRLSNRQLAGFKFVRQDPIGPYIADFVCRERRLVIELDGSQHAESSRDAVRNAFMQDRGYRVMRFWNPEVNSNLEGVLETIFVTLHLDTPLTLSSPSASGERGSKRNAMRSPLPACGERVRVRGQTSMTNSRLRELRLPC